MSVLPSQQLTNNNLLTFCRPWLPMSHIILHPGVAEFQQASVLCWLPRGWKVRSSGVMQIWCPSAGRGSRCRMSFCALEL